MYVCTKSLIAMQGCRADTEYTRSLGYSSVCYITSRIGWVSLKGIFSYRCRRNPGKLYNLQPLIPPKRFDIFPLITGGCSERLGVL